MSRTCAPPRDRRYVAPLRGGRRLASSRPRPRRAATAPARGAASAAGEWKGAIDTPGTALDVMVDLSQAADGAWQGDIDIPLQGAKDLPLDRHHGRRRRGAASRSPASPATRPSTARSPTTARARRRLHPGRRTFPFHLDRAGEEAVSEPARPTEDGARRLRRLDARAARRLEGAGHRGRRGARRRGGARRGFGLRDVEAELPVTPETLFAIGSATKAFTATVLATLADEGKLDWDEPVRTYLPDFRLYDEFASERVTPRDLVTHRSGLPRHDLVWYGSPLSREELYHRLRWLEPTRRPARALPVPEPDVHDRRLPRRPGIAGSDWETLVEERIFDAAGDGRTRTFDRRHRRAADDFARGYRKSDEDDDGDDEIEADAVPRHRGGGPGRLDQLDRPGHGALGRAPARRRRGGRHPGRLGQPRSPSSTGR